MSTKNQLRAVLHIAFPLQLRQTEMQLSGSQGREKEAGGLEYAIKCSSSEMPHIIPALT